MITWITSTTLGKLIATFFISMVPVIELRGGLPYGITLGLDYPLALTAAVIGNMVPVPFIIVYIRHRPLHPGGYSAAGHRRLDGRAGCSRAGHAAEKGYPGHLPGRMHCSGHYDHGDLRLDPHFLRSLWKKA